VRGVHAKHSQAVSALDSCRLDQTDPRQNDGKARAALVE